MIAVLWDRFNFISSLDFDTILGAVFLYQWLLRFVFKENGFKFIPKPIAIPQCNATQNWPSLKLNQKMMNFSSRLEPGF